MLAAKLFGGVFPAIVSGPATLCLEVRVFNRVIRRQFSGSFETVEPRDRWLGGVGGRGPDWN